MAIWIRREPLEQSEAAAIRAVNTYVLADERVDVSMVPIGDGLTLARKR